MQLISLLALLSLAPLAPALAHAGENIQLSMPGCRETSGEEVLEFDSTLMLNSALMPDETDASIREAALLQIKFLLSPSTSHDSVPSSAQPEIEIQEIKHVSYGRELKLYPLLHPWVTYNHPYLKKAVARGFTRSTDPALEVRYHARLRAATCRHGEAAEARLAAPLDPYLIYWSVPPDERRPLRWGPSFWVANPCATNEVVEMIEPTIFWYVWDPRRKGEDYDGHPFDCTKLLAPGRDFADVEVHRTSLVASAEKAESFGHPALAPNETLKITAVFGIWNTTRGGMRLGAFRKIFDEKRGFRENIVAVFSAIQERQDLFPEPGTFHFLNFLRSLPEVAEIGSYDLHDQEGNLLLTVRGRLKHSGRPFRLNTFFGNTSSESGYHWVRFYEGLIGDHVVLYTGHSGLGANLDLGLVASKLHTTREAVEARIRTHPYQLIGILSCYSYRYYESQLVSIRAGRLTDILTTGTPYFSAQIYPRLLETLDDALSGKPTDFGSGLGKHVRAGGFLLVKRVAPSQESRRRPGKSF